MEPAKPKDGEGDKGRYLRWLYRRMNDPLPIWERHPYDKWRVICEEHERLFGETDDLHLAHIIKDVWLEARKLAGWGYDYNAQCWRRAYGSVVTNDDGSEWRHL
jgi:hypothetical protein